MNNGILSNKFSSVKSQNLLALGIILIYAFVNVGSVLQYFSLTTDEDKHILYGERVASGNSDRIDDSKMPVTGLNVLPKRFALLFSNEMLSYYLNKLYVARSVTIFISCLLAFLVFYWSRYLFGFVPALFSLILYVLDPNIMAHSQLVTTDIYVTASISFAFFSLWLYANNRTWPSGALALFALSFAQLAKYTALILFPLFFLALVINELPDLAVALRSLKGGSDVLKRNVKYAIFAFISALIIINAGFLFNRVFTKFGDYQFRSEVFINIQTEFEWLKPIPVPFAYPYLQGFDWMINTETTGNLAGNVYLLGQISTLEGFPGYYFIASFLKVPIASQVIYLLGLFLYFSQKNFFVNFRKDGVFLLLPVAFWAVYFNFFFNTQIGIRYYLPVFPLLYILSGIVFKGWQEFSFARKSFFAFLCLYLCVSVFSYYPHSISYMNEIVWDRRFGYKYLADSNLNWDQSKHKLREYLSENPGALKNPKRIRPGHFVIDVNELVGVIGDPERFAWLRNNFEPVGTIEYSYVIYKISKEDIYELCRTTSYCDK